MTNDAARRVTLDHAGRLRLRTAFVVLAVLSCAPALDPPAPLARPAPASEWDRMVASEEAMQQLATEIKRLNQSVLNLQLPDESIRGSFGDFVEVRDLVSVELTPQGPLGTVGLTSVEDARNVRNVSLEELALWRPLLDQVEYF